MNKALVEYVVRLAVNGISELLGTLCDYDRRGALDMLIRDLQARRQMIEIRIKNAESQGRETGG